jgi:hypothetical protein
MDGVMTTRGACGHPLCWFDVIEGRPVPRHTPWCRVCWTAEQTTEAINARLVKTKPKPAHVLKVTSVNGKPALSPAISFADVSGFVPGQTYEVFDGSGARYRERAHRRGREDEANAWEERALISRAFMRSLTTSPSTAEIAGLPYRRR